MKKRIIVAIVFGLLLVCIGSRLRFHTIDYQKVVLFNNPFEQGSGSARADILNAFDDKGKPSEKVKDIFYIGSNRKGIYYLCKYIETDGTMTEYYAFDDNDLNSTARAKVFWNCSIPD